jgi:glycosyltransferase involved in cell wall biosynthesis
LKICFDLRATQKSSRYTGVGVYTYEVARRLVLKFPDIYFLVRKNCELPFKINENKLIEINSFNKPESLQEIFDPLITKNKLIKNNIDIFHSPIPGYLKSNSHFKVITTIHDVIPEIFSEEKHKPFFNHYLYILKNKNASKSDFIIFNSFFTKNDFINLYGKPKKSSVIYLGAAQKELTNHITSIDFNYYGRYMFYIGGFNKRKNFDYIIKIMPYLIDQKELNLVIGGNVSVDNKNKIKNLCKLNNVDYLKVYFTGKLNSSDLSSFYKFSLFFIYPSLYEGFGLPIAEALNENCLIFTTNNSSIPEVGGESVVYISGTDLKNDSELINDTLENLTLINELKEKSKDQKKLFSWDKTVDNILNVYENV